MQRLERNLSASPNCESSPTLNFNPEYCRQCIGLEECQHAVAGNRGYRIVAPNTLQPCRYQRAAATQARIERLFNNSGIPKIYRKAALETTAINANNLSAALDLITNVVATLLIIGPNKTEVASAIGNELIRQSVDVMYITAIELVTNLRFDNADYYKQLNLLSKVPALIIDDFGNQNNTNYNNEQLELILNQRDRNRLTTVIACQRKPPLIRGLPCMPVTILLK